MFIKVTRVYRQKGAVAGANGKKPVKTQEMVIQVANVETVRPSNRLGHPEHRSTITLRSGGEVDVADTYSAVTKALGVR